LARCPEPSKPNNGTVVTSPLSKSFVRSWEEQAEYTCDKDFTLTGKRTRKCFGLRKWVYNDKEEYYYNWNGEIPVCTIDSSFCKATTNKLEVYGNTCYQFFEAQTHSYTQAESACKALDDWEIAFISNVAIVDIIDSHMTAWHRISQRYWLKVDENYKYRRVNDSLCAYAFVYVPKYRNPYAWIRYFSSGNDCNNKYGYICQYRPTTR
ncbi:unnamed protein product, partial [Owenia fusiformis]